jgi:hypothetical protein
MNHATNYSEADIKKFILCSEWVDQILDVKPGLKRKEKSVFCQNFDNFSVNLRPQRGGVNRHKRAHSPSRPGSIGAQQIYPPLPGGGQRRKNVNFRR